MPNALRTILDARNMDPVTLAQRLRDEGHDVSYHTVIAWYYGYRTPGEDNAAALAATLGVDVAEITYPLTRLPRPLGGGPPSLGPPPPPKVE